MKLFEFVILLETKGLAPSKKFTLDVTFQVERLLRYCLLALRVSILQRLLTLLSLIKFQRILKTAENILYCSSLW